MQLINILFITSIIIVTKIVRKNIPLEKKYLYLMLFTLPWVNDRGLGPIEFGFTIYPHYIFAFCFIFTYLLKKIRRKDLIFYRTPLDISVSCFIFVTILSLWQVRYTIPNPLTAYASANSIFNKVVYFRSMAQIGAVAYMILIYWFMVNVIQDKETLISCLKVLFVSSLVFISVIVFNYLVYLIGVHSPNLILNRIFSAAFLCSESSYMPRLSGLFTEPAFLGVYILTVIPVPFCLYKLKVYRLRIIIMTTVFFILAIVFTFSKTAYLGLIIILLTTVFYIPSFKGKKKKIFLAIVISTVIGFFLFKIMPENRLIMLLKHRSGHITKEQFLKALRCIRIGEHEATLENWGILTKLNNIMSAFFMWKEHPFLGIGWGNYVFNYFNYNPQIIDWFWGNRDPTTPEVENLYIRIVAETGIIGFSVFIYIIRKIIVCMLKGIRNSRSDNFKIILILYLATFLAILITYNSFSNFYVTHIWILLAMGMAILRLEKSLGPASKLPPF